jgi:hypothetical protein
MPSPPKPDALRRLNGAAGPCGQWIRQVATALAPGSRPAADLRFERLATYFPPPALDDVRVVTTPRVPVPPFSSFGIPEFTVLEEMAVAGITFDRLCIVHEEQATESVHFHEFVHAIQWAALGAAAYMLTYGVGILEHGYAQSPLEVAAYDMQSQFDREQPVPRLVDTVRARACDARDRAAALFRAHGLEMGA